MLRIGLHLQDSMAYPPRLCFDGAIYHVTARGDNREPIFFDEVDYQQYVMFLRRYQRRFSFRLHAYVLMPNHVHLLLEPAAGTTISRIMQCVTGVYTRWFNHRHGRVGHLFQGRFRSRLIEHDTYLLAASRYIHLNPVRAGLATHPADYVWSSYSAYQRLASHLVDLVNPDTVLSLVETDIAQQRAAYCAFVESSIRDLSHEVFEMTQPVAGSAAFVQAIQARYGVQFRSPGRPKKRKTVSDTVFEKGI